MAEIRPRQPIKSALLAAALCACAGEQRHTGKIPEGPIHQHGEARVAPKIDRAALYDRHEQTSAEGDPRVERTNPALEVIGVAGTLVFHKPKCEKLKGMPDSMVVRFVSAWDAVDSGYSPCPECKPGP